MKLGLFTTLISLSLTLQPSLAAQTSTGQFAVTEFQVELADDGTNPFDRLPRAHCVGPNGQQFSVPGFFTGGNNYSIRVSFPEPGNWTVSSEETDDTWQVSVAASPATKGPVVIHEENPQHFYYANGEPCFMLAFECDWLFALDLEVEGLNRARTLLNDIKDNGFNQVVMNVYAHDTRWANDPKLPAEYDFAQPKTWPYGGDNDNPDYSQLNLEFFNHFDGIIEIMNELDLTAHVMIYVWNKQVNWPPSETVEDNRYFDYVVARYQAYPNILWDISKEATGYGHNDMGYIVKRIERLEKLDGHDRLVTVHSFSYCAKYPDTVDFISYQNWSASLYNRMLETYQQFPDKPVFNIEHGGYEDGPFHVFDGDYDDPVACLDRNYQCVFGGVYSTYYWQDASWDIVVWDKSELRKQEQPRYDLYKHMAKLFNDVDYSAFKPAKNRMSSSGYALESDDDRYLLYLPPSNKRINTRIEDYYGKPMRVKWFDPLTGNYTPEIKPIMEKWLRFEPPWQGQPWVLIIEP